MEHAPESNNPNHQLEANSDTPPKKEYTPPRLIEYGSFAKLTKSGGVGGGDAMLNSPCL